MLELYHDTTYRAKEETPVMKQRFGSLELWQAKYCWSAAIFILCVPCSTSSALGYIKTMASEHLHCTATAGLALSFAIVAEMASTAAAAATKMHLIKGDRHLYAKSDDSVVVKQILATHSPDGRDIDTMPLLKLVEDILQRATPTVIVV